MATRRRRGEDGISFEHRGPCRDPGRHRHCPGLWRGEVTVGYTGDGKRTRRKVSGQTKAAVVAKLRDLHYQLDKGIVPKAGYVHYTVRQAAGDWLATGLDGRSATTVTRNQNVLELILTVIGARKLRDLTAADVRQALSTMATGYSTAAVTMGHRALKRAIRHAEAGDLVARKPGRCAGRTWTWTATPGPGRPSRRTRPCGGRSAHTARPRPGGPAAPSPSPKWRSKRCVLCGDSQAGERLAAGERRQDTGLVFTTHLGAALDAGNVRKMFKRVCTEAGAGDGWTPRDLRTSFVSLLSHRGVSIEEIARLVGHASTRTTEVVCRRELRPVITTGAEIIDELFRGS